MSKTGDRTSASKLCANCGGRFFKLSKLSAKQWGKALYCSHECRAQQDRKPTAIHQGRAHIWVEGRKVLRARAVVEAQTGRSLLPDEVVHHIDGDKLNDSPENLELCASQSAHMVEEWRSGNLQIAEVPGRGSISVAHPNWP